MIIPIPFHIVGICEGYNYALGLEANGVMVRVGPVPQNWWYITRWRRSGGLGRRWEGAQHVLYNSLELCCPAEAGVSP